MAQHHTISFSFEDAISFAVSLTWFFAVFYMVDYNAHYEKKYHAYMLIVYSYWHRMFVQNEYILTLKAKLKRCRQQQICVHVFYRLPPLVKSVSLISLVRFFNFALFHMAVHGKSFLCYTQYKREQLNLQYTEELKNCIFQTLYDIYVVNDTIQKIQSNEWSAIFGMFCSSRYNKETRKWKYIYCILYMCCPLLTHNVPTGCWTLKRIGDLSSNL